MRDVKFRSLEGVQIPQYATEGSAGIDLVVHNFQKLYKGDREVSLTDNLSNSISNGYLNLRGFERLLVGTGLFVEVPIGYELQIRPRSGNALKRGLAILNSPGTIDSDYRGEIGVIIYNSTQFLLKISLGEKIAQAVLAKYEQINLVNSESLSDTIRGNSGFGSSSIIESITPIAFG